MTQKMIVEGCGGEWYGGDLVSMVCCLMLCVLFCYWDSVAARLFFGSQVSSSSSSRWPCVALNHWVNIIYLNNALMQLLSISSEDILPPFSLHSLLISLLGTSYAGHAIR